MAHTEIPSHSLWCLGQPMRAKLGIGIIVLLMLPLANALSVPGYEARHLVGLKTLILSDNDIIVDGQQYVAYAWWNGTVLIDMRFIETPNGCREEYIGADGCFKFKSVLNHELAHLYCYKRGSGFEHNQCFKARNYYLSRWYDVPLWGQDE